MFKGERPALDLPLDFSRPAIPSFRGKKIHIPLPGTLLKDMETLAANTRTTLFMVLLGALSVLLSRYARTEDVVIGTTTSGRNHADTIGVVGCLIKTLALRTFPKRDLLYADFLSHIRHMAIDAFSHQEYAYGDLVDRLNLPRNAALNPLFSVMLLVRNFDLPNHSPVFDCIEVMEPDMGVSKLDLTLEVIVRGDAGELVFEYATNLFTEITIRRMAGHLMTILAGVTADPGIRLSAIDLMTTRERDELVNGFCPSRLKYDPGKTVIDLIEHQAGLAPDKTALVCDTTGRVSHKRLMEGAGSIARMIYGRGIEAGEVVAVFGTPSALRIAAILGILKAGCVYLPMDCDDPAQRIGLMIKTAGARCALFTDRQEGDFLPELPRVDVVMGLDGAMPSGPAGDCRFLPGSSKADQPACILFTSGSTGVPKGIVITHGNIRSYSHAFCEVTGLSGGDCVLQQAAFTFDGFTEEVYPILIRGGILAIPAKETARDIPKLTRFIDRHGVSVVSGSPLLLREINRWCGKSPLHTVHTYIGGGDILKWETIGHLLQSARVFNSYGPTETTVCASFYRCAGPPEGVAVPIGTPIPNARIYLLDDHHRPVPPGVPGHIAITGPGLSPGYLNDPDLTGRVFVDNPFSKDPEEEGYDRLYLSGDMGRIGPSGVLEFLGRRDDMVKIRGFRIEPAEIVSRLLAHPAIEDAVVLKKEAAGEVFLQAYVVSSTLPALSDLRAFLVHHLPAYMIPARFVHVERIPFTRHGKVDSGTLLGLTHYLTASEDPSEPLDAIETRIQQIWASCLKIRPIGVTDDFFELGGDSIKAMTISAAIYRAFEVHVDLADFFSDPTVRALAHRVRKGEKNPDSAITPVGERQFYPLSCNQKRLWVHHEIHPESTAYHLSGRIRHVGALDGAVLEKVIETITARHDSLRTGFTRQAHEPVQFIEESVCPCLTVHDLSGLDDREQTEGKARIYRSEASLPFELSKPPLFRFFLIRLSDESVEIGLTMHHLITDGWSIHILQQEITQAYRACMAGKDAPLPPNPLRYVDFAQWDAERSGNMDRESLSFRYWEKILATPSGFLNLPYRTGEGPVSTDTVTRRITGPLFHALGCFREQSKASLFSILYAGFALTLSRISGQDTVCCGIPASGRTHALLQPIVGFFVNTVILKSRICPRESFEDLCGRIKEEMLDALAHQNQPLEPVCEDLNIPFPRIQVFFNMLNMQDVSTDMDITGESYYVSTERDAKFDLVFYLTEYKNGLEISCRYRTEKFIESTVYALVDRYVNQMDRVLENPRSPMEKRLKKTGRRIVRPMEQSAE